MYHDLKDYRDINFEALADKIKNYINLNEKPANIAIRRGYGGYGGMSGYRDSCIFECTYIDFCDGAFDLYSITQIRDYIATELRKRMDKDYYSVKAEDYYVTVEKYR